MPLAAITQLSAVRMIWQDGPYSIGETYYSLLAPSQAANPPNLYSQALALYKARSLLMGASVVPVSCRMSSIGKRRAYTKIGQTDLSAVAVGNIAITVQPAPAFAGSNSINLVDGSSAQGPDAILTDVYGSDPASHNRKYMAGCPNVLIRTNPNGPYVSGDAAWGTLFNSYGNLLINNPTVWVMRVLVPVLPSNGQQIVGWALDSLNTTYLSITCATLPGGPGIGQAITIHGARMISRNYKAPNGTFVIRTPAPLSVGGGLTQYTLQLPFANRLPYLEVGYGYCGLLVYNTDTYSNVLLAREGSHRRGNSGLAPRGRRRNAPQISS